MVVRAEIFNRRNEREKDIPTCSAWSRSRASGPRCPIVDDQRTGPHAHRDDDDQRATTTSASRDERLQPARTGARREVSRRALARARDLYRFRYPLSADLPRSARSCWRRSRNITRHRQRPHRLVLEDRSALSGLRAAPQGIRRLPHADRRARRRHACSRRKASSISAVISKEIERVPTVQRVYSLATANTVEAIGSNSASSAQADEDEPGGIRVEPLIDRAGPIDAAAVKARALRDPMLRRRPAVEERTRRLHR